MLPSGNLREAQENQSAAAAAAPTRGGVRQDAIDNLNNAIAAARHEGYYQVAIDDLIRRSSTEVTDSMRDGAVSPQWRALAHAILDTRNEAPITRAEFLSNL